MDDDYQKGADYAQGRTAGSQMAKDADEGGTVKIAVDALFQREAYDKAFKSEAYERGYDWGKETYGKKEHEVEILRRTSGGGKSSGGSGGYGGSGGSGGSGGYGHGKASPWLRIIDGLILLFIIFCVIIPLLSIVLDSTSLSSTSSLTSSSSSSPSSEFGLASSPEYEFDYENFYNGHTGVPEGNVKAVPFHKSALIPSESARSVFTAQSSRLGDSYFTNYENGWYVNSTTLHSSPDGGKTWYILLTVENMPAGYYREIMTFHDVERKDGRYLCVNLMGDQQAEILSRDGGRSWRHISYEFGNGYVMRRTSNQGKTWIED